MNKNSMMLREKLEIGLSDEIGDQYKFRLRNELPDGMFVSLLKKHLNTGSKQEIKRIEFRVSVPANIAKTIVEAAWGCVLYRFSCQENITIGKKKKLNEVDIIPLLIALNDSVSFQQLVDDLHLQSACVDQISQTSPEDLVVQNNYSFLLEEECTDVVQSDNNTPLRIAYKVKDSGVSGQIIFDNTTYDDIFIEALKDAFETLLPVAFAQPQLEISQLPVVSENKQGQLYVLSNGPNVPVLLDPLVTRFELLAHNTPDATAVLFENKAISYAELNQYADTIAKAIVTSGKKTEIVGIYLERSVEMVAAIIGIQKVGAYLPLDPGQPTARIEKICTQSSVEIIVTSSKFQSTFDKIPVMTIDVESLRSQPTMEFQCKKPDPDQSAYVIYTSGSTGEPKGVVVSHQALINRIDWMQQMYGLQSTDKVLQKTPYTFDVSVWEFMWPLSIGATLVVAAPEIHKDPFDLMNCIRENEITVLHFVPSALQAFLSIHNRPGEHSMRKVFCSGEALTYGQINLFSKAFPQVELHNLYGPTEAAIDVTYWDCSNANASDSVSPPIGRPIQNMQCLILNNGKLAPIGMPGELFLSGIGLADGYLNQLALTEKAFVDNPFHQDRQLYKRMYKTGDLARYLPSGEIEYLGRNDHQVKIRGNRIELSEIDIALEKTGFVQHTLTLKIEEKLVAFVIPLKATEAALDSLLRNQMKQLLPDYMIPHHFVTINEFPITSNGKTDRKKLIQYFQDYKNASVVFTGNERNTGEVMRDIWAHVLKISPGQIDAKRNFLELGGDSLTMLQVLALSKEKGIHFTLKEFMNHPYITIGTNTLITANQSVETEDEVNPGDFILAPVQQWFFEHNKEAVNVIMHIAYHVSADLIPESIPGMLQKLVAENDSLQLKFRKKNGVWLQYYDSFGTDERFFHFERLESSLQITPEELTHKALERIHIENGPLMYAAYFITDKQPVLFIAAHHLVIDSVSWSLFQQQLEHLFIGQSVIGTTGNYTYKKWIESGLSEINRLMTTDSLDYWFSQNSDAFVPAIKKGLSLNRLISTKGKQLLSGTEMQNVLMTALLRQLKLVYGKNDWTIMREGHGRNELSNEYTNVSGAMGWYTSVFPTKYDLLDKDLPVEILEEVSNRNHPDNLPDYGISYGILKYLAPSYISQKLPVASKLAFNYLGDLSVASDSIFRENQLITGLYSSLNSSIGSLSNSYTPEIAASEIPYYLNTNGWIENRTLFLDLQFMPEMGLSEDGADAFITGIQQTLDSLLEDNINEVLSPFQKGLYSLFNASEHSNRYNINLSIDLPVAPDVNLFRKTCISLVERHELLRTAFEFDNHSGEFRKTVFNAEELECSIYHSENEKETIELVIGQINNKSFSPNNEWLIRFSLILLADNKAICVINAHHLLLDGHSLQLMSEELMSIYTGLYSGQKTDAPKPIQFSDFIKWIYTQNWTDAQSYWKELIEDHVAVPINKNAPTLSRMDDFEEFTTEVQMTADMINRIRKEGVTLSATCNYLFGATLSEFYDEKQLFWGNVVSLRSSNPVFNTVIGPCIATIPVIADFNSNESLFSKIRELQLQVMESLNNAFLPLNTMIGTDWASKPMNALFSFQQVNASSDELTDQTQSAISAHFPLTLVAELNSNRLILRFCYNKRHFSSALINSISAHYNRKMRTALAENQVEEVKWQFDSMLSGEIIPLNEQSLIELFQNQATKTPDAIAIRDDRGNAISYRELDLRSNTIAQYLLERNISGVVGVCMERSIAQVISVIGIIKSGNTCSSLETSFPEKRWELICSELNIQIILADLSFITLLNNLGVQQIIDPQQIISQDNKIQLPPISGNSICTINYTSGSTGIPKMVKINHLSHINRIDWLKRNFPAGEKEVYSFKTLLSFAPAIRELFEPLSQGATLQIVPDQVLKDAGAFASFIRLSGITRIFLTPSFLQLMLELQDTAWLSGLHFIELSGEAVPADLVKRLKDYNSELVVLNRYGATEAASVVYNQWKENTAQTSGLFALGQPIQNTVIRVVQPDGQLCPKGICGEIIIESLSVANGYAREEQDSDKFSKTATPDKQIFRTGDNGYITENDLLMYVGRNSRMLKIRGYRVEPEEIETIVLQFNGIVKAVAYGAEIGSHQRLLLFVIAREIEFFDKKQLFSFLKDQLPDYMIPHEIYPVNTFPLTSSGKIDLVALSENFREEDVTITESPNHTISELLELLSDLMGRKIRLVNSTLLETGIDSLLVLRLIHRIQKQFGVEISIREIYHCHTLLDLGELIEKRLNDSENTSNDFLTYNEQSGNDQLFLFPPAGGNATSYASIVSYVPDSIAVVSFNFPSENIPKTLEELARFYAVQISELRKSGRMTLSGWSLGATLAFAVAVELEKAGTPADHVVLIDPGFHSASYDGKLTKEHLRELCLKLMSSTVADDAFFEEMVDKMYADSQLISNYEPIEYEGDVLLIKPHDILPEERNYSKAYNGLEKYCFGEIKVERVPGNHMTIISDSSQETYAALFNEIMNHE